jgi:hypothetical protein
MPYMDTLTPDLLGSKRSPLTLAIIEGWMLYPNDQKQRERTFAAAKAQHTTNEISNLAKQIGPDTPAIYHTLGDLSQMLTSIVSAPRLADIHEEVRLPYVSGIAAGLILFNVVVRSKLNPKLSGIMHRAKTEAIAALNGVLGVVVSKQTIENEIWKNYRCVAHLWAASVSTGLNGDTAFPCRLDNIEIFLAEAEAWRREGESLKPLQSPGKVLRSFETIRPREDLIIPRHKIQVAA